MTPAQAKKLGECVKRFARSNAGYTILDNLTSYLAGGCWILAAALKRLLGDRGELVAVTDVYAMGRAYHHVLVRVGSFYVDARGANDAAEVQRYWREEERLKNPQIVPLHRLAERELIEGGVPCDPRRVQLVYETLKAMHCASRR